MKKDFQSLSDLYRFATTKFSKRPFMDFVDGGQSYTFSEFNENCRRISRLLSNFGINTYDKVALFSQNMPNWAVAFFATVAFGRITVPMLTELSENEIVNILTHSDAKALFVSKRLLAKVPETCLERMNIVICTDDLSVLRAKDESYTCDGTISHPQADDIAAILYTSGTTGAAKGVMLTHRNFCANVVEAWGCHKVYKKDVFLSVLPLAHTYELSIGVLYPFARGARVYYLQKSPTPSILMKAFKEIRPTTMLSVPLIIEKIYRSNVLPTIEKSRFLSSLRDFCPTILYRLVGFKLKKSFGGRMKFFGIGGAKLDIEVESFLKKARFPYAIGYGLTETAPLICGAGPKVTCVGSTGRAARGVQVKLDNVNPETGEGEIIAKGDNVMKGYYKDYYRTLTVMTPDGWFHTGDLAIMDKKGRFFIKGRLGNLILGPSGENIYPEEIESVINNIEGINDSLVVERDGHLVALVHFEDNILDWNTEKEDKFVEDLENRKKEILDFVNSHVNKNSKIKEIEVERDPFVKTATLKIKRFLYKEKKS